MYQKTRKLKLKEKEWGFEFRVQRILQDSLQKTMMKRLKYGKKYDKGHIPDDIELKDEADEDHDEKGPSII